MDLQKPVVVYTADSNMEAHLIVDMLLANDVSSQKTILDRQKTNPQGRPIHFPRILSIAANKRRSDRRIDHHPPGHNN